MYGNFSKGRPKVITVETSRIGKIKKDGISIKVFGFRVWLIAYFLKVLIYSMLVYANQVI